MEKIKVVIDYERWITGTHGDGDPLLLNEYGFQCCLGFICEAEGVDSQRLAGIGVPSDLEELAPECLVRLDYHMDQVDSDLSEEAMGINDSINFDDRERVERLKQLFTDTRYELEWINLPWE